MKRFKLLITGSPTSMYFHQDDVLAADAVSDFRNDPKNKHSKKGDDRFPSWTWKTYLYHDGDHVALPSLNLMACLRKAGTEFKLGGSRKSLKAATQSCIRFEQEYLKLTTHDGRMISVKDVDKIKDTDKFLYHQSKAGELGMLIDARRVRVGAAKHVRCRPKFPPGWKIEATAIVTDEDKIPPDQFKALLEYAGEYVGLGDWRPGAPMSPGVHGRFTVEVTEIE